MSTLIATNINTANGTTDMTIRPGNTTSGGIVLPANGSGVVIQSSSTSNAIYITSNSTQSTTVSIGTADASYSGNVASAFTINANNRTGLAIGANNTQLSFAINPQANGSWLMYDRAANGGVGVWSAGIYQANGNVGIGNLNPTTMLSVAGTTYHGNAVSFSDGSQFNSASSLGMRNRIINGTMVIDQRNSGASFTVLGSSGYGSCDRWASIAGATSTWTMQRVSTSGLSVFPYALQIGRNTSSTSTSAVYVGQVIESINCQDLAGQSINLSFYAKAGANFSASSNNLTIEVWTGSGTDQGWNSLGSATWTSQGYAINSTATLSTTFQRFTFSGTVPSGTNEIAVRFSYFGVGTAGANDWFQVTGVQLEQGSVATPFERRPYGTELTLCQRYYQIISFGQYQRYGLFYCDTTTSAQGVYYSPVTFRSTPTLTFSNISLNGTTVTSASAQVTSCTTVYLILNVASGLTTGTMSQLYAPTTSASYIAYNAEL